MREIKGLRGYGIKGLRKTILNAGFLILDCRGDCSRHRGCGTRSRAPRSQSPDAGRGADADRGGRFGIMQNVEMLRLAS